VWSKTLKTVVLQRVWIYGAVFRQQGLWFLSPWCGVFQILVEVPNVRRVARLETANCCTRGGKL
jgi:hypothetical protein